MLLTDINGIDLNTKQILHIKNIYTVPQLVGLYLLCSDNDIIDEKQYFSQVILTKKIGIVNYKSKQITEHINNLVKNIPLSYTPPVTIVSERTCNYKYLQLLVILIISFIISLYTNM